MAVWRVLLRGGTPCRLRLLALANILAGSFLLAMTLATPAVCYCLLIPAVLGSGGHTTSDSSPPWSLWTAGTHRTFLLYVVINLIGNMALCVLSDPGSPRAAQTPGNSNENGKSEGAADRSEAFKAASKLTTRPCSASSGRRRKYPKQRKQESSNAGGHRASTLHVDTSSNSKALESKSFATVQESARVVIPLRAFPCQLCEKVVLRRDHHCFFLTVCVGYYNQKHFIFFCFFMMVGALYVVVLTARFLHVTFGVRFHGPQTFFLLLAEVLLEVFRKQMVPSPFLALLLFQLYVCLLVGLLAAGLLVWHLLIMAKGQTTWEATHGVGRYNRGVRGNVKEVMGRYWPLLFLIPLPLPQDQDGRHFTSEPSH